MARAIELTFGPGLTVISGETGAGKSLLVDALGCLSGARTDSGMVRHGAERAELSAQFDLLQAAAARAWLLENEFDESDQTCHLRRTVRADGRSRAWINGRPAALAQLAALSARLLEIHGQHAQQTLLSRSAQLALLDDFGHHAQPVATVAAAARHWSALLQERRALAKIGDVAERSQWLQYQLQELDSLALEPAALAELDAAHRRHAHAASLIAVCERVLAMLDDDDAGGASLPRRLQQARNELARELTHEPRLAEVDAALDAAVIQIDEGARLLQRIRDDLDLDPARLQALEATIAQLHALARKHRVQVDQLAGRRDLLHTELKQLQDIDSRLTQLDTQIEAAAAAWRNAAKVLSQARRRAAGTLAETTSALLVELGMAGSRFAVELLDASGPDQPDPQGAERVEFLVSANAGQPPRPLRKVASGGELSRISLAIEVAALGHDAVPTMVFDEVDSGIGGAVADIVGRKLRALGTRHQALCVTHLPQVAAQGHAHYRVSKAPVDGATQSAVEALDRNGRIAELARMLGGSQISTEVEAAARRLLDDAAATPASSV